MALNKSAIPINFSQGLDLKSDPKQVSLGRFLALENSIFTKAGLLQKRNGNAQLPNLPDTSSTLLTTFNGNLTAVGSSLAAFSKGSSAWVNKGSIQPVELEVSPIIRSNTNQSQADSAIAANGLICTVYTDNIPVSGTVTPFYKYVITDQVTGQNIVPPTVITTPGGIVQFAPKVFLLGRYFIILFDGVITATHHLQYIAINTQNPTIVTTAVTISSSYAPVASMNVDAVVANNALYMAWNGADGGGAIRMAYLSMTLVVSSQVIFAGKRADLMSVCADNSGVTPVIYASFYDSVSHNGYTLAVNQILATVLAPVQIITGELVSNITSSADVMLNTVVYEVTNAYTYDSSIPTHYLKRKTITQLGVVSSGSTVLRSLGLASKAFQLNNRIYMLAVYSSVFQPTYFLIDSVGNIISRLAYSNGSGYYVTGLPSVSQNGDVASIPYLIKDTIQSVNKTQGAATAAGIYSQTGINLVAFNLVTSDIVTAEIGGNLNLTGGFLWMYDGYTPVEQGFHVWPDNVEVTTSGSGGLITAQQYFYQVTYEWADNQGNVFRSAPSVPVSITTTGTTSSNTINVPTLRLTYKTANPVKISVYRWSVAQQTYYQVTSISNPILNDLTVDSIAYVDTVADSSIIGNNILYTTGGVLENTNAPASSIITLFNNRLFLVDAEDPNLLWYSKQVIESTPVEMSDLLTIYVAPTTSAQGSTGPTTAASALDDKLILFKNNAIYYISGSGPDNTGANSQYSDAIFITSTVGCANQQSIVFMPSGLMFQSDKGIWLLGRDLSTSYIGAPVESLTQNSRVKSAVNVPGTNQVRFTMDSGITLMYDYFYGQWGTFTNIPAISSTLYQSLHTYLDSYGRVFQESPGSYLDGSAPVLLSFKTSWANLAGLQGYERAYFFYLLGEYISPHRLTVQVAYDYNDSPTQVSTISPDNYSATWGDGQVWGSQAFWGGQPSLEQWRIFFQQGKCQAFQITVKESFDPQFGTIPGAGLTISGLNLVVGQKSGYPRLRPARSVG